MGLEDYFRALRQASDLSALWATGVRYFKAQGFAGMACLLFDRFHDGETAALLDVGLPPESVSAYGALGFGRDDPTLRIVMQTGRPNTNDQVAQRFKLSADERRYRRIMLSFELGTALYLPMFGPQGRDACTILLRPETPQALDPSHWPTLHIAAQAGHLHAFSMMPERETERPILSPREMEILRWVAQGKSNGVIADILEIAPGTVDTYMRRIYDKLAVSDRTSAAIRGVGLGLIAA